MSFIGCKRHPFWLLAGLGLCALFLLGVFRFWVRANDRAFLEAILDKTHDACSRIVDQAGKSQWISNDDLLLAWDSPSEWETKSLKASELGVVCCDSGRIIAYWAPRPIVDQARALACEKGATWDPKSELINVKIHDRHAYFRVVRE